MKKTRGKKKEISSFKKVKKFFLFNKTITLVLTFVFLALAILLPIVSVRNNANLSISGNSFLDDKISVKFPDVPWLDVGGDTWRDFIVFIIVLAIIFVILLDILMLSSFFEGWVSAVIALGTSIILVMLKVVRGISVWVLTFAGGLGVAAGFIEIAVSAIIFIGLIFGSSQIAIWAAKRKAQREELKAIKGAGQAGGAITALKMIQKKFRA